MEAYYIDSYHYGSDYEKDNFYRKHELTKEEKVKTKEFIKMLEDFVIKTNGKELLDFFSTSQEASIYYQDGLGYIAIGNYDRDLVNVYHYGKTKEEALLRALLDYEFYYSENYEFYHRKELNKQYSDRFLNGNYNSEDYHGTFFFAEIALKDFRKYYGDNLPIEIINYYENYLKEVSEDNFKYDYETNEFIKIDVNVKRK